MEYFYYCNRVVITAILSVVLRYSGRYFYATATCAHNAIARHNLVRLVEKQASLPLNSLRPSHVTIPVALLARGDYQNLETVLNAMGKKNIRMGVDEFTLCIRMCISRPAGHPDTTALKLLFKSNAKPLDLSMDILHLAIHYNQIRLATMFMRYFRYQSATFNIVYKVIQTRPACMATALVQTLNVKYLEWTNCFGNTLLMMAIKTGKMSTVCALLERGADPNASNEFGETPLFWAAKNGNVKMVETLFRFGAVYDRKAFMIALGLQRQQVWRAMIAFRCGRMWRYLTLNRIIQKTPNNPLPPDVIHIITQKTLIRNV
jgi:hypothetical protein